MIELLNIKPIAIAVDFDGTCVTHAYPDIGKDIGAVPVLKELVNNGHKLILWTMRANNIFYNVKGEKIQRDEYLTEAVSWFRQNDIPLFGINENREQKKWSASPKVYANLYIDDVALGCPLLFDEELSNRPFVDWKKVRDILKDKELI